MYEYVRCDGRVVLACYLDRPRQMEVEVVVAVGGGVLYQVREGFSLWSVCEKIKKKKKLNDCPSCVLSYRWALLMMMAAGCVCRIADRGAAWAGDHLFRLPTLIIYNVGAIILYLPEYRPINILI